MIRRLTEATRSWAALPLLLSVPLSAFWTLVFHPAVMSNDAVAQWEQATHDQYSSWHPPGLAMLMHVSQRFYDDPSLFAFVQGSLFWLSLFYAIRCVVRNDVLFLASCVFTALLPPIWLYSNATLSNTWGATFCLLSAALLIRSVERRSTRCFGLSLAALAVVVIFRREGAILVCVPILTYLLLPIGPRATAVRRLGLGLVMAAGVLLPARLIELGPRVGSGFNPIGHALLNQYVGTLSHSRLGEAEFAAERASIDREFGVGSFRRLLHGYVCDSGDYIVWDRHVPAVVGLFAGRTRFIVGKIFSAALRHPLGYIEHQACYFSHLSQRSRITYQTWGVLEREAMVEEGRARLGLAFDSKLPAVKAGYVEVLNAFLSTSALSWLFRHYLFLIAAAAALATGLWLRRPELILPAAFGLVYPLGFLVAGPTSYWRYLLPSYLLGWVCLFALLGVLLAAHRSGRVQGDGRKAQGQGTEAP